MNQGRCPTHQNPTRSAFIGRPVLRLTTSDIEEVRPDLSKFQTLIMKRKCFSTSTWFMRLRHYSTSSRVTQGKVAQLQTYCQTVHHWRRLARSTRGTRILAPSLNQYLIISVGSAECVSAAAAAAAAVRRGVKKNKPGTTMDECWYMLLS